MWVRILTNIETAFFIFFLNPSKILNFFKIKSKNANKKPKHLNPILLKNLFCAFLGNHEDFFIAETFVDFLMIFSDHKKFIWILLLAF
jgi:hypothetical protein